MRLSKILLAATLVLAACTAGPDDDATWEVDRVEEAGALLSVWGSGANDVWAAGGRDGQGLVLHNDGSGWQPVETGATELLWWVYGFSSTDVYAVGDAGLIMHYDGAAWQRIESGTDSTLFGVWGSSGGDVWIVGGDAGGAEGSAVVLHGDGTTFNLVKDLPTEFVPSALFKIYGGPQGLVTVGTSGTVLRFDGEVWSRESTPTKQSIFSLWGRRDNDVYAVGGVASGEVLHFDGNEWIQVNDEGMQHGLSGVFTAPNQPMIAVGEGPYVLEIMEDGRQFEPELPTLIDMTGLHGVWGDGSGTTYAVGGDLYNFDGPSKGVILKRN